MFLQRSSAASCWAPLELLHLLKELMGAPAGSLEWGPQEQQRVLDSSWGQVTGGLLSLSHNTGQPILLLHTCALTVGRSRRRLP